MSDRSISQDRLFRAWKLGLIKTEDIQDSSVSHDRDCGVWKRRGCSCNPDCAYLTAAGVVHIQKNGTVR